MITQVQEQGGKAMLVQIRVPPNYGKRYSEVFSNIYPQLSQKYDARCYLSSWKKLFSDRNG